MRVFDPDNDIQGWAKWIVGMDFGYDHPFAAALCAWVPEIDEFFVVDGFKMERSEALYHVKRIAGMCRGLRIPIAWPHDGLQHEKGSGIALADVYRRVGAPMLGKHAENKGGGYHVEPAVEEMCGFMKRGAFDIASHLSEFGRGVTELPSGRGLQDRPAPRRPAIGDPVRLHDAPKRKAPRRLRNLRPRTGDRRGSIRSAAGAPEQGRRQQFARGTPSHPDGDINPLTGQMDR